eukprot:GHVT01041848.1.p1 GENE.GHVT01041848.1~~GHVT01041848.1.p1  ORF type:complete len:117 (+),score=5.90 GHVT01041848.1:310-660(+)
MGALNSILVIKDPIIEPLNDAPQIPQLDSLVMMWQRQYYMAVIDETSFIFQEASIPNCPLNGHKDLPVIPDKKAYNAAMELRKEAAERFVEIFEAHPSLNDMSLIVYATSKQWSKM